MDSSRVIAIDGPAGSGKSTLARRLAAALGWRFLDTGVLYRAMAAVALERGLASAPPEDLVRFALGLDLDVKTGSDQSRVTVGGRDVTGLLRTPEVSTLASRFASLAEARESVKGIQRRLGSSGRLVTEGRDQGTAIFPEARLKFFLTAAPEARAERRYRELLARGRDDSPEAILAEIKARDRQDQERETDPLKEAPDAFRVDSTALSEDEVLSLMLARAREVFGKEVGA
ncbi:MAG: (d)CMP kinase [Deltaproteobacteria bacterium]|jgi:cytidylate kinase|nr:(d)CMP kinase [Deltaproteobacteria bacterium]